MESIVKKSNVTTGARVGRVRHKIVLLAFVGNLILWGDRANIGVAAPEIVKAYHWSPVLIGSIFSAFTFGYWLMQIPGGRLGDFWPKRISGWCAVWWSAFTALTALAAGPALMMAIRALVGAGEGPFVPATTGLLSRWLAVSERGRAIAFNIGASQLGPALCLPFAGWLISEAGWKSVFYVFGALGLAWAVIWFLFVTDTPEQHPQVSTDELRYVAATRGRQTKSLPMAHLLRDRTAWGIILSYFALPYTYFMVALWVPSLLVNKFHVSIFHAGFLSAMPPLLGFIACVIGGVLVDAMIARGVECGLAHKIVIGTGFVIAALSMCVVTTNFSVGWVTLWLSFAIGGGGLALGVFWTLAVFTSPRRASGICGAMNFSGITGAFISPFLTGWIVDVSGSYSWAFLIDAGVLMVCLVTLLTMVSSGDPMLADEAESV